LTLTKISGLNLLGRVDDDHGQIACGTGCASDTGTYPQGTVVVLTEQPGLLRFDGWSGACSGTGTTCTVTMTGNKSVTARFALFLTDQGTPTPTSTPAPRPMTASWLSTLDAPDSSARVMVNGAAAGVFGRGVSTLVVDEAASGTRVEGVLSGASGPGTWRFERAQGAPPVHIKVVMGQAVSVTPAGVVFRLRGDPGEEVSFVVLPRP
jgi:uncharacterized repeat protein (TIGR02543 family)